VVDSGSGKHLPVRRRNGPLIADHKRDDHAHVRRAGQGCRDSRARELARPFDPIAWTMHDRRKALRRFRLPHVTGGAKPSLEQPGLVIESVRIGAAVRPPQAHDEPPALAGTHPGRRAAMRPGGPPREDDPARYGRPLCDDAFDIEFETHPPLVGLRQACDHAHDGNVAPLPGGRQGLREACLCTPRRQRKSGGAPRRSQQHYAHQAQSARSRNG